ncbi:uncharacterized protein [Medicago truncatula]|uniref:uncharacterized protein n=1 Tax=Medicago truncatula TaxID=3880 RepID=UPI000D2F247B|nr:uncharacterized protein LOC112419389 [Medicago truncatula]
MASFVFSWSGAEGEAWAWRRLWVWEEEMLEECRTLLFDVSLHVDVTDQWLWLPDPLEGYSVRGAYHVLTSKDLPLVDSTAEMIWHRQVPLKVSVFAWRLLRDRFPTKFNLVNRSVISSEAAVCVSGCGSIESAQHLMLFYSTFASLWPLVCDWIGFMGVDSNVLFDHFVQFVHSTGVSKARKSFLRLIWLPCAWVLWTECNNRLFNNTITPISRLLNKVKYLSLGWLKAKKATFMYGTDRWWSSPF